MEQVFFNFPLTELEPIFKRWVIEAQEEFHPRKFKTSKENNNLLTVKEAAKFLSLAVPTIYSKVCKSELPFMKKGKRLYFSEAELLAYVKSGRNQTDSEIELEVSDYLKKRGGNDD